MSPADAVRSQLLRLTRAVPFRPFVLGMADGGSVRIDRPESLAYDPDPGGADEFRVFRGTLRLSGRFADVTAVYPAASTSGPVRWGTAIALPVAGLLLGSSVGVATNAVNAAVSTPYYTAVLGLYGDDDASRRGGHPPARHRRGRHPRPAVRRHVRRRRGRVDPAPGSGPDGVAHAAAGRRRCRRLLGRRRGRRAHLGRPRPGGVRGRLPAVAGVGQRRPLPIRMGGRVDLGRVRRGGRRRRRRLRPPAPAVAGGRPPDDRWRRRVSDHGDVTMADGNGWRDSEWVDGSTAGVRPGTT